MRIIAVTGGDLGQQIDGKLVERIPCGPGKSGPDVELHGYVRRKPCVYIRFAGGLDIPVVMGSRSTNLEIKGRRIRGKKIRNRR